MIEQIIVGREYRSKGGYVFRVTGIAYHGQDCSIPMVIYTSLRTADTNEPRTWVIEESMFLKRMTEL